MLAAVAADVGRRVCLRDPYRVFSRDASGQGRFCTIFRSYSRGAQVTAAWLGAVMQAAQPPPVCWERGGTLLHWATRAFLSLWDLCAPCAPAGRRMRTCVHSEHLMCICVRLCPVHGSSMSACMHLCVHPSLWVALAPPALLPAHSPRHLDVWEHVRSPWSITEQDQPGGRPLTRAGPSAAM